MTEIKEQISKIKIVEAPTFRRSNLNFAICFLHFAFKPRRGGFSLIEAVIAMAIVALLAALVMNGLSSYRESAALDQAVDEAFELLRVARSQTLGSEGGSGYGVHFDTANGRLILFRYFVDAGGTPIYNNPVEPTNTVVSLPSVVEIPDFAFTGTTTDTVYFERLTGETKASGIVTFRSTRSGKTRAVEIFPSGAVRKQ